jgi:hypothetical protein
LDPARVKANDQLDDGGQEEAQWVVQIVQEIIAIAEQKDARNAIQDQEV